MISYMDAGNKKVFCQHPSDSTTTNTMIHKEMCICGYFFTTISQNSVSKHVITLASKKVCELSQQEYISKTLRVIHD